MRVQQQPRLALPAPGDLSARIASSRPPEVARSTELQADRFERPPARALAAPAPSAPEPAKLPILLYNDQCAVCRAVSRFVDRSMARDPNGPALIKRPIGDDPDALREIHPDLDIWDAYESVHVVMPDGTMKIGGEAVAEVLRRLPNTGWFAGLFDVSVLGHRPFQAMLDAGYVVLDKIRPALGCESCGHGPPWWAMPLAWAVKGWKAISAPSAPGPAKLIESGGS